MSLCFLTLQSIYYRYSFGTPPSLYFYTINTKYVHETFRSICKYPNAYLVMDKITRLYKPLNQYSQCTRFGSTYTKIGTIQRRLAWPLRKDDTQIREAFHIFFPKPFPCFLSSNNIFHILFKNIPFYFFDLQSTYICIILVIQYFKNNIVVEKRYT